MILGENFVRDSIAVRRCRINGLPASEKPAPVLASGAGFGLKDRGFNEISFHGVVSILLS
jgi:hypothetical protein